MLDRHDLAAPPADAATGRGSCCRGGVGSDTSSVSNDFASEAPLSRAYTLAEQLGVGGAHMAEALAWLAPQMEGCGEPDVALAWAPSPPAASRTEVQEAESGVQGQGRRGAGARQEVKLERGLAEERGGGSWGGVEQLVGGVLLLPCFQPPSVGKSGGEGLQVSPGMPQGQPEGGAAGAAQGLRYAHLHPHEQEMTHSPGQPSRWGAAR